MTLPTTIWSGTSRTVEVDKETDERRRTQLAADDPSALVGTELRKLAQRTRRLPPAARSMALHGLVRTAVYQDSAYAERYLQRVARFAAVEPDRDGEARLTLEAARHIALWMCYQDTIHVALQKTRRARMERVRAGGEGKARPAVRGPRLSAPPDRRDHRHDAGCARRRAPPVKDIPADRREGDADGMILNTTSVVGYTLLTTMARLRPLRPRSLRFVREQGAIESWIEQALAAAAADADLAREIVECQAVLKGYGSTWAHGAESFAKLMATADSLVGSPGAATRLAELRAAALADEDGTALQTATRAA